MPFFLTKNRMPPSKLFSPFLVILLLLAMLLCATDIHAKEAPRQPPAQEESHPDIPRYSLLFQQAQRLQKEGKPLKTLKTVEAVYGCEVPVQSFYDTLDRFRIGVINHIDDEFSIRLGRETYTLSDLKTFFVQVLLTQPDALHCSYLTRRELPLGRFLFLNLVYGNEHPEPTKDRLLKPASPHLDLSKAIQSPDPWVVSAALFMARKQKGGITLEAVIKRWQKRPDLWDAICTEQAMLYLAMFKRDILRAIRIDSSDVREQIEILLKSPVPDENRVQVLAFWMGELATTESLYLNPLSCQGMTVEDYERTPEKPACEATVARQSGKYNSEYKAFPLKPDAFKCRNGMLSLAAGTYLLKYRVKNAHGSSRTFHCRTGRMTRLVVMLFGHI
jgi:hypothetical protein